MADFNFSLPFNRQQAVTRNPQLGRQQYQHLPRDPHGCHVFCGECFRRVFLGPTAFKFYLLVAWCVGLSILMLLQKPNGDQRSIFGFSEEKLESKGAMPPTALTAVIFVYLISQIFGLLAVVTEIERIFIPYVVILVLITITNIVLLSIELSKVIGYYAEFYPCKPGDLQSRHLKSLIYTCCLVYNLLCAATVVHLCTLFDKKRLIAQRRQREAIAQNARIYSRLVELNNRDQPVSVNVDSPPKYSSLMSTRPSSICTPPPGYSQLKNYENVKKEEEDVEKTSHRSLFKN